MRTRLQARSEGGALGGLSVRRSVVDDLEQCPDRVDGWQQRKLLSPPISCSRACWCEGEQDRHPRMQSFRRWWGVSANAAVATARSNAGAVAHQYQQPFCRR
ncbi:hypothetical protein [Pseudomonas peli]|uniref:hypothetical protein n=1 Tax=Pseudomonas peli TaxID=592361 RepID=UPI0024ACACCD|nr:hypothetical protein [Pseudomonas peli]